MVRRAYQAVSVKKVSVAGTLESLAAGVVYAGVDIGKNEVVTVLRDAQGRSLRPWKTLQPSQVRELVALLVEIAAHRSLIVAMENPLLWEPLNELRVITHLTVVPVLAAREDIVFVINELRNDKVSRQRIDELAVGMTFNKQISLIIFFQYFCQLIQL